MPALSNEIIINVNKLGSTKTHVNKNNLGGLEVNNTDKVIKTKNSSVYHKII